MQKVASLLPSWDKTKTSSKKGFDKAWGWADKLGAPVNRLSNRIGSEAFWPTTMDKESDKAARILRSFCKDGFYAQEDRSLGNLDGPAANTKQRIVKKIPAKVIQNAVGLAIFTTMRTGLWISGAGGSGVLIARREDGEWSPPSGILLHTAGLGFLVGVDVYDCVLVINTRKALESFTKIRATLGGEISAVAGPIGAGGVLENDGKWKQLNRPVFTYLKSRGFYAGVQVDGTVIIERSDENERFYGERIGAADILAGKARHPPVHDLKMLMETIKAAEGRSDIDQGLMEELEGQPAPGDVNVDKPTRDFEPSFGIPEPDDPDPFGVLALEKAGLEIREAGTRSRPPSSQFEYRPSPTSPIYSTFGRKSVDTLTSRNGRESYMSHRSRNSVDRGMQTVESSTQTEGDEVQTPVSIRSVNMDSGLRSPSSPITVIKEEDSKTAKEVEDVDYTKIDLGPYANLHHENSSHEFNGSGTTANSNPHSLTSDSGTHDKKDDLDDEIDIEDDVSDFDEEEPVVFEAAAAQTARPTPAVNVVQARGSLVTIAKRIPPTLPPRSPMRGSKQMVDAGHGPSRTPSPAKDGFESVELVGNDGASSVEKQLSIERSVSPLTNGSIVMEDLEKTENAKDDVHLDDIAKVDEPVALSEIERSKTPVIPGGFDDVEESKKATPSKDINTKKDGVKDDEEEKFHSLPPTPADEAAAFA